MHLLPLPPLPLAPVRQPAPAKAVTVTLAGIFLIMIIGALSLAREFLIPVTLAVLIALTLSPVTQGLQRRGVPPALSAPMLVVFAALLIGTFGYLLSSPVSALVADAPRVATTLSDRLSELRKPLDGILAMTEQVGMVTASTSGVQQVTVQHPPAFLALAASGLASVGATLAVTLVLALFLLASGGMLYERVIEAAERAGHRARLLRVAEDVQREISRYLLTITLINFGLGAVISHGLWMLGVPNALLWGVAAALFNFMPYIGSLITILLVAAISLVSFDNIAYALLPPAFVLLCDIVEGQFVSPAVIGRRLEINTVAIFIAVTFWTWLWGFLGALMAVPLLVLVKVVCDNFEGLHFIGGLLSAGGSKKKTMPEALPDTSHGL